MGCFCTQTFGFYVALRMIMHMVPRTGLCQYNRRKAMGKVHGRTPLARAAARAGPVYAAPACDGWNNGHGCAVMRTGAAA